MRKTIIYTHFPKKQDFFPKKSGFLYKKNIIKQADKTAKKDIMPEKKLIVQSGIS